MILDASLLPVYLPTQSSERTGAKASPCLLFLEVLEQLGSHHGPIISIINNVTQGPLERVVVQVVMVHLSMLLMIEASLAASWKACEAASRRLGHPVEGLVHAGLLPLAELNGAGPLSTEARGQDIARDGKARGQFQLWIAARAPPTHGGRSRRGEERCSRRCLIATQLFRQAMPQLIGERIQLERVVE